MLRSNLGEVPGSNPGRSTIFSTFKIVTDMQFIISPVQGDSSKSVEFLSIDKIKLPSLKVLKNIFFRLGGIEMSGNIWHFPDFINSEILQEIIFNTCFECGGEMKYGKSVRNRNITVESYDSYQGIIKYPDPNNCSIIRVRKCTVCGHSHT